jgi:hypothetical protein
MTIDLPVKLAAFCRELADSSLSDMARQHGMEPLYQRAVEALKTGRIGPELQADLDALDAMVRSQAPTSCTFVVPKVPTDSVRQREPCLTGECKPGIPLAMCSPSRISVARSPPER